MKNCRVLVARGALCAGILIFNSVFSTGFAQGTGFTYQGRLNQNGAPYTGSAEFQASLWSVPAGGSVLANNLAGSVVVGVSNGLFLLPLDFGANFSGSDRWLELDVRTALGAFTQLSPRQQLTPTPYAIYAGNVNAAGISGAIADAQLSTNIARLNSSNQVFTGQVQFNNTNSAFRGAFTGNGAGITNVPFTAVNSFGSINWDTFVPGTPLPAGPAPAFVITPDINGDGRADVVCANSGGNTLSVFTNNGNGGFVLSSLPVVGNGPVWVMSVDINGDGKPDLISANYGSAGNGNTVSVLTNNGSGGFVLSGTPPVGNGPLAAAAGDFNGDGRMDLAVANYTAGTVTVLVQNSLGVLVNPPTPLNVGGHPVGIVATTNLLGLDGDTNIALIVLGGNPNIQIYQGQGNGTFNMVAGRTSGNGAYSGIGADLNGDGVPEFILGDLSGDNFVIYNFIGNTATTISVPGGPTSVTAADLNGDGHPDLITANHDGTVSIFINNGSGAFTLSTSPPAGANLQSVAVADLNGDGKMDLIAADFGSTNLPVLLNSPHFNGAFSGDGSGLLGLDAANFSSGLLSDARLSPNVALLNASQTFSGANTMNNVANSFSGNGAGLTGLAAGNISSGTLSAARLPAGMATLVANQTFTGTNTFNSSGVTIGAASGLSFGTQTRQMLNLWGTQYGLGVQSYTLYFRTDNTFPGGGFAWYQGGVHADMPAGNPGAGGKTLMSLDSTGSLHVTNNVYAAGVLLTSDRNVKENFSPLDAQSVLTEVLALPITRWNFKQEAGTSHIGPMAQDFHAAFGAGDDDKHIAVVDEGGVALAAIQGLNEKLEAENAELKGRLEKLERLMESKDAGPK